MNPPVGSFPIPYPPGHLKGLKTSWSSVAAMNIAVGTCRDSTNKRNIDVTSTLTATITTAGANGLDTGSEANNTWYALYVIATDAGATAALLSTSFTAPTLPGTYTHFRRVGAVYNDATGPGDFEEYFQTGNRFQRANGGDTATSSLTATSSTSVSLATHIPPSGTMVELEAIFDNVATGDVLELSKGGETAPMSTVRPGLVTTNTFVAGGILLEVGPTQNVNYLVTAGSVTLRVPAYWDEL